MELLLLKLVAFLRPVASIDHAAVVFDLAAISLFTVIAVVFFWRSATTRFVNISATDIMIVVFAIWCLCIYAIYFERAEARDLAKLLIPLLSFIVVKNVVVNSEQYRQLLVWIIAGFSIPVFASVALIAAGEGVDYVSYWTQIPRWQGAYTGAHSFGHSMTLFIMVMFIYFHLFWLRKPASAQRYAVSLVLAVLGAFALYGLYKSQVRSAILGLIVFLSVYLYFVHRKLLVIVVASGTIIGSALFVYWMPVLLPELTTIERGIGDYSTIGSGRQQYWRHNLELFATLPVDQQLAGVGIGNRAGHMDVNTEDVLDSHNDWIDLLTQTGIVGLFLFAVMQVLIFRSIRSMPREERPAFLALFVAVALMMFASNSYVWRIQVGQLYYMVLAFIEYRRNKNGAEFVSVREAGVHRPILNGAGLNPGRR